MQKSIAVVGGDNRIMETIVRPGTTSQDLLAELGLTDGYWLSTRNNVRLGDTEPIFGLIQDGDKLFASPKADVG